MPRDLVFIATAGHEKQHARERKLVRSHCMRGRNRKHPQPNRHAPPSLQPLRPRSHTLPSESEEERLPLVVGKEVALKDASQWSVPFPPPMDLYFASFPAEVDPRSKHLLFKYYGLASNLLYIDNINEPMRRSKAEWNEWFAVDVAFMHAILSTVCGLNDFVRRQPISKLTFLHLKQAIRLLNQHLNGPEAALSDSTVGVVVMLGYVSQAMGELGEVRAHLAGLKRIVQLRGGLSSFHINSKLAAKIRHLDISFYLITGQTPCFLVESLATFKQEQSLRLPWSDENDGSDFSGMNAITEPRLARLFRELQMLINYINVASNHQSSLNKDINAHDIFYSIQYQLIQLHGAIDNSADECIRLAMLAFMATTYRVPSQKMPYHYLTEHYRASCKLMLPGNPDVKLWLLLIGAISVFDVDESWLEQRWRTEIPDMPWEDIRRRLQNILWIEPIHDGPGKQAFNTLSKKLP